jgi:hypothetical protein
MYVGGYFTSYAGVAANVLVSTDAGAYSETALFLSPTIAELSSYFGRVYSFSTVDTTIENNDNQLVLEDSSTTLWRNVSSTDQGRLHFTNGLGYSRTDLSAKSDDSELRLIVTDAAGTASAEIILKDNATNPATSANADNKAIFIGTNNSTIDTGVINSAIIGGSNITATFDNTVYQQDSYRDAGNHTVTTTNNTTAIGAYAGATSAVGDSNTLIGAYCAFNVANSFSQNTIIGGGTGLTGSIPTSQALILCNGNASTNITIHSSLVETGSYSANRRIPIKINGTQYYLLLST